ncbi:peroxiredoxin [Salinibacter ruber]|jgi:peroxiredoxin|uniref:Peroxiredoxin n=1 Tax=Salinibacter ruber TaxID=146919 RepID=A0A9X2PT45_9BACT|nr:TlpA disulfide reductase family protein [Salinibacter ruber]MCS3676312.1 peroxiredoxin [Salinibacter ruber]MCS3679599.1 peroxiredoxin [Salinibacter ruber]MCS4178659.1 peroxiredoxin [Salinibacter ruber]
MNIFSKWHVGAFLVGIGGGLALIFFLGGETGLGGSLDGTGVFGTLGRTGGKEPPDPPKAPDFALERLNGETFRLSEHRGTVVVINFWATWCPPCRKEVPDFVDLQKSMTGEVLFVGVSLDEGGAEKVRDFTEKFGVNYPVVIDDGTVAKKYGPIPVIPTSFVVDPKGRVRLRSVGLLTKETLRPVLRALVRGETLGTVAPPFQRVGDRFGAKR